MTPVLSYSTFPPFARAAPSVLPHPPSVAHLRCTHEGAVTAGLPWWGAALRVPGDESRPLRPWLPPLQVATSSRCLLLARTPEVGRESARGITTN